MEIMFPVARMIGGSVYKAQVDLDNFKKPKMNADGTPSTSFSLGIAIPKGGEQHWSQTPWGAKVMQVAASGHPNNYQHPAYAWKIKDGDSKVPNKVGKIPAEQEGSKGHWVIWFKQKWAPKLVTDKGTVALIEPEAIVPGYYVEVWASVECNTGPTPGLYLNPLAVNRVAFGEKMATSSVDTTAVGFGQQAALPVGASLTPVGGGFAAPATPFVNVGAGQQFPNPAFLQVPAIPVPPPPPAAPTHNMTPKAGANTYDALKAAGWTDALLVQHGYMLG